MPMRKAESEIETWAYERSFNCRCDYIVINNHRKALICSDIRSYPFHNRELFGFDRVKSDTQQPPKEHNRRLVVYIGPPKTASTSLQSFFFHFIGQRSQKRVEIFKYWHYPSSWGSIKGSERFWTRRNHCNMLVGFERSWCIKVQKRALSWHPNHCWPISWMILLFSHLAERAWKEWPYIPIPNIEIQSFRTNNSKPWSNYFINEIAPKLTKYTIIPFLRFVSTWWLLAGWLCQHQTYANISKQP